METLTIRIKDSKALKLIHDLADLDLIQVMDSQETQPVVKLSALLADSISAEQAAIMQDEVQAMRNEWNRQRNSIS